MGKDKKKLKKTYRTSSPKASKLGGKNQKMGPHIPLCNFFLTFPPMFIHYPHGVKNALGAWFIPITQCPGGYRGGFIKQKMRGVPPGPQGCPRDEPFWGFDTYPKGK